MAGGSRNPIVLCVYRQIKAGDEVRQGARATRCLRRAEFGERPAHRCSTTGAF